MAMDTSLALHPPPLRAHLLGPVRLTVGDRALPDQAWPRRSARSLLLLLLATPGHRLPRDRALDLLWPEASPEAALNALRVTLHALRRVLEPDLLSGRASAYVESSGDAVGLRPLSTLWVDVDAFEAALARGEVAHPPERTAVLREALVLYSGDLLADEHDADWPRARRERLRRAWRHAVLDLAELELAASHPLAAVPVLERLVSVDPADETAHRTLMRALVAAGRRDEALRQYARCIAAVRDELDIEPDVETVALAAEIRSSCPVPSVPLVSAASARRFDNLPTPPTPMIGRERELERLQDLLLDPGVRLVTVTGPGGIGKTRLALEAAWQAAEDFADGVCFVSLAAIRDPQLVMPTIARTLEVDEVAGRPMGEVLGQALRERELLLVLDNLEQVVEASGDLGSLLAACPRLTILATSREPLRLRAEHIVATPPLAVPPLGQRGALGHGEARYVERYEAVTLFAERARAARPDFVLTDANASAVAALCTRLDGLPLAIELAAARSRHLTPAELVTRWERPLPLLTGGPRDLPERQRTLRNAITWSHDLLSPEEQALFRRLAVFAGGFTLEAAEWVCLLSNDDKTTIAEGVWALVDKSLLRRDDVPHGETRFGMLETIREYGLEQLVTSDEEVTIRDAHTAFFLSLAEEAEPELTGPRQGDWFDLLELEHDNLRTALSWALNRREANVALRLGAALGRFWMARGYLTEGRTWLERALATENPTPLPLRAAALMAAGSLAEHQNDYGPAERLHEEALAAWRQLGNRQRTAAALSSLGNVSHDRGDYGRAMGFHEEALAVCRDIDDSWGVARALNNLGAVAYYQGFYDQAEVLWTEALSVMRRIGDSRSECQLLNNLGAVALQRENLAQAAALHEESLALRRRLGDTQGMASSLINLGEVAQLSGNLKRAAALLQEGAALMRDLGDERQTAIALLALGHVTREQGDAAQGAELIRESMALLHRTGDRFGLAGALEGLAGTLTEVGRSELAAHLFAAAAAVREATGAAREVPAQAVYDRDLAATRTALGEAAFASAWATGWALTMEEAIAEVLAEVLTF